MSNTVLSIQEMNNVVAGKFVPFFVVVDQEGSLVGKKSHAKREAAELELGSLKYFAKGMDFARATAPEGTNDKALVGKANIVAAYELYLEQQSQPVSDAVGEVTEEVAETTETTEPVSEQEEF